MGEGYQGVQWAGQDRELALCYCANASACAPTSIFNVLVCVPSFGSQGSLTCLYLSRDHHCFPFPGDTELL